MIKREILLRWITGNFLVRMNQTKLMWCDVLWFYFVKWTPTPRAAILKEDRETVSSLIPLLGVFNIQIHSTGIYWEPLGSWWISNYGVREIKPDKTSMPRRKITAMIYLSLHTQLALSTCGSLVSGDLLGSKTGICSSPYIKWLEVCSALRICLLHSLVLRTPVLRPASSANATKHLSKYKTRG